MSITVDGPGGVSIDFPDGTDAATINGVMSKHFGGPKQSFGSHMLAAVTDIPKEIGAARNEALETINQTFNPWSETARAQQNLPPPKSFGESLGRQWDQFKQVGSGLASIPAAPLALLTGTARSLLGHPYAALTGMPYEQSKEAVDTALLGLAPGRGIPGRVGAPPTPPPTGPLGVTLSEGQATRDLGAIQREQAALRAPSGRAGERAKEFATQQAGEVVSARDRIARGFDPFNQTIAETPQEAAQLAQRSIQTEAANRKAGVTQSYERAKALPGEIEARGFDDIGTSIKTELSARPDPVVIDDKLTPFASHAIQDVERRIANLQIQNRASPTGQPPQNQIAGITLEGVDQMRRRLTTFRQDAYRSGNSADGRAASAVVDAFDAHIDRAINGGAFIGDPRAIQAWNTARAAHADYKATFGKGKNDPVGRVVERILGTKDNPAAIPNDVADFLYGSSGVNPNSLNVAVTNRVKSILGDQSPEWSGVQQGLFSRLVETPPGVTDFGPGKIAQRINKFLSGDGKELAEAVFTPMQRSLIKQYADLQGALEVPQAGANWSNTSTFLKPILEKIRGGLMAAISGAIAHTVAPPGLGGTVEALTGAAGAKVSGSITGFREARQIAKQMPLVLEAAVKFQRATTAYNKLNNPPSQVALSVATSNLARALKQIGVDITAQAPAVGRAEDQPEIPRPIQ